MIQEQIAGQLGAVSLLLYKSAIERESAALLADAQTLAAHADKNSLPLAWASVCQVNPELYKATMRFLKFSPYSMLLGEVLAITNDIAGHHGITLSFLPPFISRKAAISNVSRADES